MLPQPSERKSIRKCEADQTLSAENDSKVGKNRAILPDGLFFRTQRIAKAIAPRNRLTMQDRSIIGGINARSLIYLSPIHTP